MTRKFSLVRESWPVSGTFTIARGSKTMADVLVAEISDGGATGRGECVPYGRYGESLDSVTAQIEALRGEIESGLDRHGLQLALAAGAARNALDCALWDLEAKRTGKRVWQLAGLEPPRALTTAFTISLDSPQRMAHAARLAAQRPLIKIKLGAEGDEQRLDAIRAAAPHARLIVDANEGWPLSGLEKLMQACAGAGVELIEQPLPASKDAALAGLARPVPLCADESAHGPDGLAELSQRYDAINIKLDKTGGLTGALALASAARSHGLDIMVGCMLATSLSMAPAMLVAQQAGFVDLDGPLLLRHDRMPGLIYEQSLVHPPAAEVWG